MNNFYITGFARSGTTFLSSVMNKSKQWTVKHEARGYDDKRIDNYNNIQVAFQQQYYGEVNYYLYHYLDRLKAGKVGIITREPQQIYLSIANRRDYETLKVKVKELNTFYTKILPLYYDKVKIIEFSKMTTDKQYLENTLLYFGINDVDMDSIDLSIKINNNVKPRYSTFDDLPNNLKQLWNELDWQ